MMIDRPESGDETSTDAENMTEPGEASGGGASSAKSSADADEGAAAADEGGGSEPITTQEHAARVREVLTARREAEKLRGEASRLWEEAASEAEKMVAQAQELARQLVEEARSEAETMSEAAQSHADALTSGAEQEALRLRKQVEEEVAAMRMRAEAAQRVQMGEARKQVKSLVQTASSSLVDLRSRLETSRQSIDAVENRLRELADTLDVEPDMSAEAQLAVPDKPATEVSLAEEAVEPAAPARPGPVVIETRQGAGAKSRQKKSAKTTTEETPEEPALVGAADSSLPRSQPGGGTPATEPVEGRPLGWLFRAQ